MANIRKIKATVEQVIPHGESVYTVELSPSRKIPSFRPGQFLHLALDEYDPSDFWPDSRVFSIASPPSSRKFLRICYSVKGQFTARMEHELTVGKEVWVKLPYGEFVVDPASLNKEAVLIAGGTGFSAFAALTEDLTSLSIPVHLVYAARLPQLLVYENIVLQKCSQIPKLSARFFCEQPDDVYTEKIDLAKTDNVEYYAGRPSLVLACSQIEAMPQADYFLAGPPSMIDAFKQELCDCGVLEKRVHIDEWS